MEGVAEYNKVKDLKGNKSWHCQMPISYFSNIRTPNKIITHCPTFGLQLLLETRRGDVPDGGCADQRHHVVRDVSRCGGLLLFPAKIPHTQRRVQQRQTSNVGSHGWVRKQMPKKHPKAVRLFFHSSIIFIHKGPQVKILPAYDAIFWRGVSWPFS